MTGTKLLPFWWIMFAVWAFVMAVNVCLMVWLPTMLHWWLIMTGASVIVWCIWYEVRRYRKQKMGK